MATTTTDAGTLVEQGTPLTRNHWFDGKFLRADDLARDQDYHRAALRLANQAGGFGVVHGLEVTLAGAELLLQPGLGITADGELLLLSSEFSVGVDALVAATAATPAAAAVGTAASDGRASFGPCEAVALAEAPTATATGWRIYRITLGPHRALCGFEDVVGALCERACVTERQRPYQLEGVRLRARLQPLAVPALQGIEAGGRHARSRIASALFALDDGRITPLPDNGGRLLSPLWCTGTGFAGGGELTLGYLVRGAGTADFVDLWSGRRERMAPQAEAYWQRRTRQRPLADFIAQVAQFQCQLTQLFSSGGPVDEGGDCEALRGMVRELEAQLKEALNHADPGTVDWTQASSVAVMRRMGKFVQLATPLLRGAVDRVLLERGIVEVPPAGFLPVTPSGSDIAVQVQRLLGPGVRLQLCSAPLDAIGHLFQEAQHSARSSLTRGIVDPADKPLLQIIVPDGEAQAAPAPQVPPGYGVALHYDPALLTLVTAQALADSTDRPAVIGTHAALGGTAADAANGAAAAMPASVVRLGELLSRRLHTTAANVINEAPAAATAATTAPATAAGDDGVLVAEGAGRVLQAAGGAPGFALAVRGLAPQGDVSSNEIEAAWMELGAAGDPFAAAPGARVALQLRLAESDRPGASFPAGASAGYRMTVSATLVLNDDPAAAERMRAEIEQVTGLTGGDIRLAALVEGALHYALHVRDVPGTPDGLASEGDVAFAARNLALQRVVTAGRSHWVVALPIQGAGVLMFERVPQPAAASRIQLRMLSLQATTIGPVTHVPSGGTAAATGTTVVAPLATLREDAQALAAGAAPRAAAEAGFAELDRMLKQDAPTAAQRERLLGAATPAPAPTGLRGVHDWVLFRRPVDARCTVTATPPAPSPAPVVVTRYRASVLRLVPNFNGDAMQVTLEALTNGRLPTTKAATFALAAALDYEGDATQPQQAQAALAAAFAQAGFGPVARVVAVQGAPGVAATLEAQRATALSAALGGGSTPPAVQRVAALPAEVQALDGAFVYIVDPPQAPPAPVPAPVPVPAPTPVPVPPPTPTIKHRQRVMLLNIDGLGRFNSLGGVAALPTRASDILKALENIGGRYFELDFELSGSSVNILNNAASALSGLTAAVQAASGLGTPLVPVLLRATDDAADKKKNADLAASALFDKLSGPGVQTQVVVCTPTPAQIQSQHDALTMLFTKG